MTGTDQHNPEHASNAGVEPDHGEAGHTGIGHNSGEHLAQMANDIGNFFRAESNRDDAISGIANHINRFWTPRMRQKLLEFVAQGNNALDDLPREAARKIKINPVPG
jgi:formate dehydrogenase subunit delta